MTPIGKREQAVPRGADAAIVRPLPLAHLRVIDASEHIAGQHAARLFAALGASVVLVEPEGGSSIRQLPPFDARDGASLLFCHLNLGKQRRVIEWPSPAGAEALAELSSEADVVITNPATAAVLPAEQIAGQVRAVVSDFGAVGPYAEWRGSEMVHQALAGVMFVTGDPEREPLYGCSYRAYFATGAALFNGALAALQVRSPTGDVVGQQVEVTVAETTASMAQCGATIFNYNGSWHHRGKYRGLLARLQCADGWIVVFGLRHWADLCYAFECPALATDPRFMSPAARLDHWAEAIELFAVKCRSMSADAVVHRAQSKKACVERMATLSEVLESKHFAERDFFSHVKDGEIERLVLGPAWRMSESPGWQVAPLEDAASPGSKPRVTTLRHGHEQEKARPKEGDSYLRPLEGIGVLDFSSAWAGPMTTRTLAYFGATIIKIEGPTKLDSWRGAHRSSERDRFPDMDPGLRPYDRSAWFNTQNHDKFSVGVNLKEPGARELVLRIASLTSVVIANFSPGTLSKLGIGYNDLKALYPKIIMVEMPALGNSGSHSHYVGMGQTMEAATGMTSLMGYGDGRPVLSGPAYLDPIGGLHGAAATLTALEHRRRTGDGQYVEVPQVEAAMHLIAAQLAEVDAGGAPPAPFGNTRRGEVVHQAFPCAGDDEWVAIACTTDGEWRGLCRVIDRPEWPADVRFRNSDTRSECLSEILGAIRAWTCRTDKHSIAAALQAAGVRAAPVNNGKDLAQDPHMWARGFFAELTHPLAGTHFYPTLPYRFSEARCEVRTAAPCFGEHNRYVLGDLLGMDELEIETLEKAGVISSEPVLE